MLRFCIKDLLEDARVEFVKSASVAGPEDGCFATSADVAPTAFRTPSTSWRTTLLAWTAAALSAFSVVVGSIGAAHAQVRAVPGSDGPATTGGVLNTYYPASVSADTNQTVGTVSAAITVGAGIGPATSAAVVPNASYMIVQMQCAPTNNTNTSAYDAGDVSTTGRGCADAAASYLAGRCEYIRGGPASAAGSIALAGSPLANAYIHDATTVTNLRIPSVTRVPQYSNLNLNAAVTALPRNDATGGVAALSVADSMDVQRCVFQGSVFCQQLLNFPQPVEKSGGVGL